MGAPPSSQMRLPHPWERRPEMVHEAGIRLGRQAEFLRSPAFEVRFHRLIPATSTLATTGAR